MIVRFDQSAKWRGFGTDLAVLAVLIVIAFVVRRHGLPTQGLWLDDAQEGAARKTSLSQLIMVGRDHPGYVAVLMGWSRLTGGGDMSLAYPALIAGVARSRPLVSHASGTRLRTRDRPSVGCCVGRLTDGHCLFGPAQTRHDRVLVVLVLVCLSRISPGPDGAGGRQPGGSWRPFCFHPTACSHSSRWRLRN